MSFKTKKLALIFILITIIFLINPLSFANDNETVISTDINDEIFNQFDDELISDDYYFNSNMGNNSNEGTIINPLKDLTHDNLKSNSVIHLSNGEYDIDFSKTVDNITIIGENSEKTIIKASNNLFTVVTTINLSNVTLNGLSITNNDNVKITANNVIFRDNYRSNGGAIYTSELFDKTYVTLNNCTFIDNSASYGGALNIANGFLNIDGCIFSNNIATYSGGAIFVSKGNVSINKSKFVKNIALEDAGGAIFIKNANLNSNNLNITDSSATFGGAVTALKSNTTLNYFYSKNNTAKYDGGSVYVMYDSFELYHSTLESNTARNGGAIFLDNVDNSVVTGNTFKNNAATDYAGAVYSILSYSTSSISKSNVYNSNKAKNNNDVYESENINLNIGDGNYNFITFDVPSITSLPSNYRSPYTTSVKQQSNGGNCWSFTALATLESCIKKITGKEYDLSEENMKNIISLYSDYGWNMETNGGGYDDMGYGYLVSWLGPVNESDDEYNPKSQLSPLLNSIFHVQNILFIQRSNQTDTTAIKEAVIKYGAVGTCIYWSSSYAYGKNYYYNGQSSSNHAVTIVGWDDNYSKTNFKTQPAGNGAWLIKNSWGTGSGDKGYYYVSYYDTRIAFSNKTDATFTFILNDSKKFDKNYQYDIPGRTDFLLDNGSSIWYKNRFTAIDNEYLAAVSTYFEYITNWTVSVYVNGNLKTSQSGNSPAGYFTIDLNNLITLKKGDVFEVVFNTTNSRGVTSIPISEKISLNTLFYKEGISFFSKDGKKWIDLVNYTYAFSSHTYNSQVACIKAFTIFDKIATSVIVDVEFNSQNTVDLIAHIMDKYGKTVNGGNVVFTIENTKLSAKISNGVAKTTYSFKNKGVNIVSALFSADGYISSQNQTKFNYTNIVSYDVTCYYGNVNYKVILQDANLNPLANKKLIFTLNGVKYEKTTDSKGQASITTNLNIGEYPVSISFNGDKNYMNSNNINTINAISSINLPSYVNYTYNAIYNPVLLDNAGNKLINTKINVVINGITYAGTTNSKGMVSINLPLNIGNYVVSITNPNTNEFVNQSIKIVKRIIENKAVTMYYSDGSVYKFKVLDDYANPLSNAKVTINVNGKTYTKTTDKNGYISIKISLKPKTYTIKATYKGYTVSNKIIVKSTIITKNISVKKGKTIKFTAKLLNTKGKILKNKKITFKFKGKTYNVKTNSKGIATLKIKNNYKIGKYTISSSYGGLKISNKITIKK